MHRLRASDAGVARRALARPDWWEWVVGYPARMQEAYVAWLAFGRERWPTLRVLFAMLGGGGPFQLERLARRGVDVRSALDPNTFFDVSTHGRRAIELCIETFGVGQLAYGSDTPVVDSRPTLDAVRGFGDAVTHVLQSDTPSRLLSVSDLATWLRERVPADTDLDRPDDVRARRRARRRRSTSGGRTSATTTSARFYQQLYRDPNLDVWLICWVDGQNTGYHDHDRSSGAVCVCEGMLLEDWFRVEEDGWVREHTTEHEAGGRFDFDASDIHGVRHPGAGRGSRRRRSTSTRPRSGAWATTSPGRAGCAASA